MITFRIPGSRSTNATSFMVISGGPRGSSDAIEMDEEDEAGEEYIVSFNISRWFGRGRIFEVVLVKFLESKTVVCPLSILSIPQFCSIQ